jgi:hypothetical protein
MDDYPAGIFIWIPKTAGTSVSEALSVFAHYRTIDDTSLKSFRGHRAGVVSFGHVTMAALRRSKIVSANFYNKAFKFCFVRNPYDRAVSLYLWFRRNPGYPEISSGATFRQFCEILHYREVPLTGLYNQDGISMANPQAVWVPPAIDFVGRYERLADDWLYVCKKLALGPVQLPWKKRTPGTYKRMDFYTIKFCRDVVKRYYAADFKKFGYSIDPKAED